MTWHPSHRPSLGRMLPSEIVTDVFCGGVAGCFAKTITAPLARLTVLAQTSTLLHPVAVGPVTPQLCCGSFPAPAICPYSGNLLTAMRRLRAVDGLAGLWRGNLLMLVHRFPYTGISFGTVEMCHRQFPLVFAGDGAISLVPGALAGVFGVITCYPLEVARTRMMVHRGPAESGQFYRTMQRMMLEGPASVYRGVDMALIVTVPSIAISFGSYRLMKKWMDSSTLGATLLAGGISGLLGSGITFPVDLLRKRLQLMGDDARLPRRSWLHEGQHVLQTEGWRGLWRGITPELVKVFPAVALTFGIFEGLKAVLVT